MSGVGRAVIRFRAAGLVLAALLVGVPAVARAAQRIDAGPSVSRPVRLHLSSMEATSVVDVAVPDLAALPIVPTAVDRAVAPLLAPHDSLRPSPQTCPGDALPAP